MIAEVVVNIPTKSINKFFSYKIPTAMEYLGPGWRVVVPFSGRKVEGFIMKVTSGDETGLKSIAEVLDDSPWFDLRMIETACWLSEYYLCTLAEALRLFIPGKAGVKSRLQYHAIPVEDGSQIAALLGGKSVLYQQIYEHLLTGGPCELSGLVKVFGFEATAATRSLHRLNLVGTEAITAVNNRPRIVKWVDLAVSVEVAAAMEQSLVNRPAQKHLLSILIKGGSCLLTALRAAKVSSDTIKRLVSAGVIELRDEQLLRDSYAHIYGCQPAIHLTHEQRTVLKPILSAIEAGQSQAFLLHGITGSGKTEIYLEAAANVRCQGKQVVVLVPEIALTNQIISRFKARFGNDVVVIHSKLSLNERFDAWQRLQTEQAGIVIGARSAIFAPVRNLGLIVIDEEHEFTYKQEETPRYHTRQVALMRAKLFGAPVVLGSATPALESYWLAQQGHYQLLTLTARVENARLPHVTTVDMRDELSHGRRSVLSQPLRELLESTIKQGEQAVIVLNRRGYATFVLCRECGYVVKCRHCSVTMVYHMKSNSLKCHYCQSTLQPPDTCPVCNSRYIRYFGAGTQKVEEELIKLFPAARIVRMDQDTTTGKLDSDRIMADFAAGKYDILLGTQMVAKGHDVKNVTAVGILAADSALHLPDFRAAERTFNLLTQAAGRAGRGTQPGKVVVQTYNPDHYAVRSGTAQDYQLFYNQEIQLRKQLGYPPFKEILKVTLQAATSQEVERKAQQVLLKLRTLAMPLGITDIYGPVAATVAKVKDMHRMTIIIKATDLTVFKRNITTSGLLQHANIVFDVDPINLL